MLRTYQTQIRNNTEKLVENLGKDQKLTPVQRMILERLHLRLGRDPRSFADVITEGNPIKICFRGNKLCGYVLIKSKANGYDVIDCVSTYPSMISDNLICQKSNSPSVFCPALFLVHPVILGFAAIGSCVML